MLPNIFLCTISCAVIAITRVSNILVFMPMPFKSHIRGFQPLFEELTHRGHNVTVVSSYPQNRQIANYTDIGPFFINEPGSSKFCGFSRAWSNLFQFWLGD
uniref:Ecdysteroid UDP-glucosyltransferase n=1 Tax=Schizaphis graminum TaxID=13262 RepID=A0A2S2PGE8_SCHGA